jgi:hypothetical protein
MSNQCLQAVARHARRVLSIALDLRGHGESQGVFGKLISGSRSKKITR